ncbi:unnamed protein product, partial [Ectocarpus sp. 8 AP-2014]
MVLGGLVRVLLCFTNCSHIVRGLGPHGVVALSCQTSLRGKKINNIFLLLMSAAVQPTRRALLLRFFQRTVWRQYCGVVAFVYRFVFAFILDGLGLRQYARMCLFSSPCCSVRLLALSSWRTQVLFVPFHSCNETG